MYIISFLSYYTTIKQDLPIIILFSEWRNWDSEMLHHFPKATQIVGKVAGIQIKHSPPFQNMNHDAIDSKTTDVWIYTFL